MEHLEIKVCVPRKSLLAQAQGGIFAVQLPNLLRRFRDELVWFRPPWKLWKKIKCPMNCIHLHISPSS